LGKRLSEKQKQEIVKYFIDGFKIDEISMKFDFSKLTITRNLKKSLGDQRFLELNSLNIKRANLDNKKINLNKSPNKKNNLEDNTKNKFNEEKQNINNQDQTIHDTEFVEITPLNFEIENATRKDYSSVPISEVELPSIVYMVVDKKIELETKYLKDFPDWQFLPKVDLNRQTIEIYFDLKNAKSYCNKDQKVIKVPNTNVFKIVAPILISKGISRIVSPDKLIALEKI
tara:strand:- start:2661 stop:3347 length:687 start_codon:yes stop_codon:yes gene_type:complete